MKRREALNRVAILMGGAISAPTLAAIMSSCAPKAAKGSTLALTAELKDILAELTEMIIPTTTTAGAKEAGVPAFIETQLNDCFSENQVASFRAGLEAVAEKAKSLGGSFVKLDAAKKTEILKGFEATAKEENKKKEEKVKQIDSETGKEKVDSKANEPVVPFFTILKELTVFGYLSSEIGMTQTYNYVPIPGRYEGCIPLAKGQKANALS